MKKKSDLNKSLEELESEIWGEPAYSSYLVVTIHALRKKPLKDYTIDDLRISIGQNCGLEYLIPIAIKTLKKNILAEGHYFEGDLLLNVLNADVYFWKNNHGHWISLKTAFEANRDLFDEREHRQILKSFKKFEELFYDRS